MPSQNHIHETGSDVYAAYLVNKSFTPQWVPSLLLWLKADAGVSTTLGKVTGWTDQTATAAQSTVPTLMAGPTVTNNWLNGLPGITFDGVTTGLRIPLDLSAYSRIGVYMVLQGSTAGLLSMTLEHSVNSALNTGFGIGMGGNGPATCVLTNGPPSLVDTRVFGCDISTPQVVATLINRAGTTTNVHVGSTPATVTPLVPGSTTGNFTSANLYIANRGGLVAVTCWGGTIGEICIVGAPPQANTEINMIAYLQRRWNLPS